jgi:hypothetical protein
LFLLLPNGEPYHIQTPRENQAKKRGKIQLTCLGRSRPLSLKTIPIELAFGQKECYIKAQMG